LIPTIRFHNTTYLETMMFRKFTVAASALAILATPIAATAKDGDRRHVDRQELRHDRKDVREQQRDYKQALRSGDRGDIRKARRDLRQARNEHRRDQRDWRSYRNYDVNRYPRGQSAYYADQYYRDGRYYQTRRLDVNDRIYRGRDNRY